MRDVQGDGDGQQGSLRLSRGRGTSRYCQRSRYRSPHPRLAAYYYSTSSLIHYITGVQYSPALHKSGVVYYTVLPVYMLHRYRFAQGTVVPGNLQAQA